MTSESGPPNTAESLSRREIQQRASRGALWTGLHVVVSLPLNVVATVVVARVLDVESYGELAYLTVLLAVTVQLTDLGYTASAVQWGSHARVAGDDSTLGRHLSRVAGFHVLVQAPLLVVVSLVVLNSYGLAWALGYGVISFAFIYFGGASLALVIDQRNDRLAQLALGSNIITQAAVVAGALLTRDMLVILLVRAVGAALPGLLGVLVCRPVLRPAVLLPRLPRGHPSGYWRFALYSWAAGALSLLVYSRSEVLLLKNLSDTEQTALFALAFGVAQQLTGPVDALTGPLIPATASLMAGHREHLDRAMRRAISLSSLLAGALLCAPMTALYFAFPLIYGAQFADAALLLLALGVLSTFQTATSVVTLIVQAQLDGRRLLSANLAALVSNVIVAVALIPPFGAWGAMAGNAVGQLFSIAMLTRAATTGPNRVELSSVTQGLRPWAAAVPSGAAAMAIGAVANQLGGPLLAAACAGIAGAATYAALLRVTRVGPSEPDAAAIVEALPTGLRRPVRRTLSIVTAR